MQLVLILLLLVVVLPTTTSQPIGDCKNTSYALSHWGVQQCRYFYDLLESALVNDTDVLYQLKKVFLPVNGGQTGVEVDVMLSANVQEQRPCFGDRQPPYAFWDGMYYGAGLTWRSGSTLDLIASGVVKATMFYEGIVLFPTTFMLPYVNMSMSNVMNSYGSNFIWLQLYLGDLPCNPQTASVDIVSSDLVSWLKKYAIAQGIPKDWDESDRGNVYTNSEFGSVNNISIKYFTLAVFVLINVSVILLMMRVTPGIYSIFSNKISQEKGLKKQLYCTIYWGCSTVVFFLVVVFSMADILSWWYYNPFYNCCVYSIRIYLYNSFYKTAWITVVIVKFVLFVLPVATSIVICKRAQKGIDFPFTCFPSVFCCCFCCCDCCSQRVKYKALQGLALWSFMSFVQHLAMSAVPLFFIFILVPGEAFSVVTLCLSAIFCIIMLVSHVFYMCHICRARDSSRSSKVLFLATFPIQMLLIISLLGTAVTIVGFYIVMIGSGAKFNSLGGFSASLIPSVMLTVIGWYVKNRLLQSSSKPPPRNGSYEDLETRSSNADECTGLIQK